MRHDQPDEGHPARRPTPAAPPAPPPAGDAPAGAPAGAPAEAARTPDEYTETPGSHRRPDGAATDVGA